MMYNVRMIEGGELSVFNLFEGNMPLGHITLDPTATSLLIQQLAKIRSEMKEAITPELDPGALLPSVEFEPAWHVPGTAQEGTVMLLLRHSGYGWIGYALEPQTAKEIGAALINAGPGGGAKSRNDGRENSSP